MKNWIALALMTVMAGCTCRCREPRIALTVKEEQQRDLNDKRITITQEMHDAESGTTGTYPMHQMTDIELATEKTRIAGQLTDGLVHGWITKEEYRDLMKDLKLLKVQPR